ncbi:hypothetical protein ACQEVZ_56940 [Dactylosporangium sp. CA-152071]|uniref:hypothetical protein n=1 Tax=Dactylosporangium sp. CA-152071 TaxID=3239933 RepID=UPI003D901FE0
MFKRSQGTPKDRFGEFFFKIFGPATVEGAIQGWHPEAREQYKQLRARQKEAAARRAEGQS